MVEFAGWQSGYGNVVEIRHDSKHSTLYAHLQKFGPGVVKGARISQGDLIGYVGMTGWATGPHLHFEVKIAGRHVNPLTAQFPGAEPLGEGQRQALAAVAAPLREQLALLERIRVAASLR
jgi:murein DD-endopeptidase MepM/ murein hydrolase activator NlpD